MMNVFDFFFCVYNYTMGFTLYFGFAVLLGIYGIIGRLMHHKPPKRYLMRFKFNGPRDKIVTVYIPVHFLPVLTALLFLYYLVIEPFLYHFICSTKKFPDIWDYCVPSDNFRTWTDIEESNQYKAFLASPSTSSFAKFYSWQLLFAMKGTIEIVLLIAVMCLMLFGVLGLWGCVVVE